MPGGFVCSASFKGVCTGQEVLDVSAGAMPLRKLFSKEQRAFYDAHAPAGITMDKLVILGPTFLLKAKHQPKAKEFDRPITVEMWLYPDGARVMEISTKSLPKEAFQVVADFKAYLAAQRYRARCRPVCEDQVLAGILQRQAPGGGAGPMNAYPEGAARRALRVSKAAGTPSNEYHCRSRSERPSGKIMTRLQVASLLVSASLLLLGGCATRPVNPPITQTDPRTGYRFETRQAVSQEARTTWSSSPFRAAARAPPRFRTAFWSSSGAPRSLRRTAPRFACSTRIDVITGVSGGSFTALAYGLYGEKLFDDYEQRFLKRNVQGEIIARAFSPRYWGDLSSEGWGRSELASQLYDEILFNGATFGDLNRGKGPMILASATDISTGSRFVFNQGTFDIICSDLNAVPLSRAAAASSAVPVVLSSITIKNYGGTCNWSPPAWAKPFLDTDNPPRPAARAIRSLKNLQAYGDSARRPYLHLVDGGVSDNVGMRGVLDALEVLEALHEAGLPSPLDSAKQDHRLRREFAVVAADQLGRVGDAPRARSTSCSSRRARRSTRSPTRRSSLLRDTAARWATMRMIRNSAAFAANKDPAVAAALRVPAAEIYAIDVSFAALKDKAEFDYLNLQPTTFVLPPEAVDRLRAAARHDHHGFARIQASAEGCGRHDRGAAAGYW